MQVFPVGSSSYLVSLYISGTEWAITAIGKYHQCFNRQDAGMNGASGMYRTPVQIRTRLWETYTGYNSCIRAFGTYTFGQQGQNR